MNSRTLIVPSALMVSEELRKIGELPPIIYPINQKIVFDFLYEQYSDVCCEMDIVCYEKADKVRSQLKKYKDDRIKCLTLDAVSDLGHSIYFALKNVQGISVINFADTIVMDKIDCVEGDAFYCQEDLMTDTWTYFDEQNGIITNIYDRTTVNTKVRKKLFVGVFQICDSVYFRTCLEVAFTVKNLSMSTFYCALQMYSKRYPMQAITTEDWFDIGHEDKYYNSKLEVKAREFNHISIDKNRGILRKTSDDREKFIGEIQWYLKLPSDIEYVRPRIFEYSTSYVDPYVSMEYYSYHTVHELYLYGDLTQQQWNLIFERIRFFCNDFKRYSLKDEHITAALEDMYLTKTLQRFDKMRSDDRFLPLFEKSITVNGVAYQSLSAVAKTLQKAIPEMLYDVDVFYIIHGDLCFANIMVDSNFSFIKVIDPRGKFGTYDIYGDVRYEFAKLFHSIDGKYDFIIKDLFDVSYDLNAASITYSIFDRKREFDLYKLFLETFKREIGDDIKKIELIEALLFLSMIPLHGENLNQQMVMLGTGLDILNRVVSIQTGVEKEGI